MRFYDREEEIELLRRFTRVAVIGRRRVGKTRLVEETFGDSCLTLFIPAEKSEKLISLDWVRTLRDKGIYAPEMHRMRDVCEYVMKTQKGFVIFLDELQNSMKVNKSFIYELQRLLDENRDAKVVVSGSLMSMSKKLLEQYRSPLYGRFDIVLKLKELDFLTIADICRDLGYSIQDSVLLYSVFGGIPKYYETLEKAKTSAVEFVKGMFFEDPYPLVEEVRLMLREEFGKEYKVYFSVLEAIAWSKNTFGEIGGYVGLPANKLSKYVYNLEREYELVEREVPVIGKGKSVYKITSNLVHFWFRFIWRHYPRLSESLRDFSSNFNGYIGEKFEELAPFLLEKLDPELRPMGKGWGKTKEGAFEIDLVASDLDGLWIFEVKWADISAFEAKRLIKELGRKADIVEDLGIRVKGVGLIARRMAGKEDIRREGVKAYDLDDVTMLSR